MASEAGSEMESACLLQDTVDQFEKVIDLERTLLKKSIHKHKRDLEEVSTELGMKEEELMVWEQRVQQIQQDNEVKLCLAKARFDSAKWRGRGKGRNIPAGAGPLGLIAEDDENEGIAEGDEEDDDAEDEDGQLVRNDSDGAFLGDGDESDGTADPTPAPIVVETMPHPKVEEINALADIVSGELAALRKQWQELSAGAENLSHTAAPAPRAAPVAGQVLLTDHGNRGQSGRMTVEQRIDRLQRDIRTETDRILQERGTPSLVGRMPRGTSIGTSVSTTSGMVSVAGTSSVGGGSTPVTASSGSLMAAVGQGGTAGRGERLEVQVEVLGGQQQGRLAYGSGLNTPAQSVGSRMGNPGTAAVNDSSSRGGGLQPALRVPPEIQAATDASSNASSVPTPSISPQPTSKAPAFHGSVVRCVSPTTPAAQVSRARPYGQTMSRPVATTVRSDPMQTSIGSSSGPPRWAVGYHRETSQTAPGATADFARQTVPGAVTGAPSSPPPPPVIGTSGLSLGSRGSGGAPSGAQRTAPLQLSWR